MLTYLWCDEVGKNKFIRDYGFGSHTICNWYNFCREICSIIMTNSSKERIGGKNMIVEINESDLYTRKYNKVIIIEFFVN
jgi:hypothetical protein